MKYWVYISGEVPGCFTPEELAATAGFGLTTLVCPAEGEILEKNWRRAGEFDELTRTLTARAAKAPEPPPASAAAAPPTLGDVDALIDQTGARLFSHVAGLMRELETRREERALAAALQRQLAAVKEELAVLRERAAGAESRLPRIAELEETLAAKESALDAQRLAAEKAKFDLEAARRKLNETSNDLAIRNRLVDKLSKDLAEKELSLTKALALIRRLEQDFHRLDGTRPDGAGEGEVLRVEEEAAPAPSPALAVPPAPSPEPAPAEPKPLPSAFTQDEPPAAPDYIEPPAPEPSGAHQALSKFFKKVFPGEHT